MSALNIKIVMAILLCLTMFGHNVAHAYCTCWDSGIWAAKSPSKSDPGSHCAGGIDWDTAILSHMTCKSICEKNYPGYTWAYVDQIALNKCKAQYENNKLVSKVVQPSEEDKAIVKKAFYNELTPALVVAGLLGSLLVTGTVEGLRSRNESKKIKQ